jgi:photosystem II stability/assembly factor-like uncharacterized protein
MPRIGQIHNITFLDSLTGYASSANQTSDSSYILKTTNGGDNWQIIYRQYYPMRQIQFLNVNTGYACAGYVYKTTNGGYYWNQINTSGISALFMWVLNQDTIWLIDDEGLVGGVFRTTDGGVSWVTQYYQFGYNPGSIYMFNRNIGFISKYGNYIMKTTNSGMNWNTIVTGTSAGWNDIHFIDSLTGWRCSPFGMKKTTDGGYNWITETLPYGGIIQTNGIGSFSIINRDTIWGTGGYVLYPNNQWRELLNRTTDGGNSWLFQIPDTSIIDSIDYVFINFTNRLNGWATDYHPNSTLNRYEIHTVTGGDSVWYTGIVQKSKDIPKDFILKQNYPNPFNPRTVIIYELRNTSYVRLIVYDITGREVQRLVDQKQAAGEYEVDFMGKFVSSGVYLYRMQVTDEKGNATFSDTKKMILIK